LLEAGDYATFFGNVQQFYKLVMNKSFLSNED